MYLVVLDAGKYLYTTIYTKLIISLFDNSHNHFGTVLLYLTVIWSRKLGYILLFVYRLCAIIYNRYNEHQIRIDLLKLLFVKVVVSSGKKESWIRFYLHIICVVLYATQKIYLNKNWLILVTVYKDCRIILFHVVSQYHESDFICI